MPIISRTITTTVPPGQQCAEGYFIETFVNSLISDVASCGKSIRQTSPSLTEMFHPESDSTTPYVELAIDGLYLIRLTRAGTVSPTGTSAAVSHYLAKSTHVDSGIETNSSTNNTYRFCAGTQYINGTNSRTWKYTIVANDSTMILYLGAYNKSVVNQEPLIEIMHTDDNVHTIYRARMQSGTSYSTSGFIFDENIPATMANRLNYLYNETEINKINMIRSKDIIRTGSNTRLVSISGMMDCSNLSLAGASIIIENQKYYVFDTNTLIPLPD